MEPDIDYLITIVRKSDSFVYDDKSSYGIRSGFKFKDDLYCYYCNLKIDHIKEGDKWYLLNINCSVRNFCNVCLSYYHTEIKETYNKNKDLLQKIPSRIIGIQSSIIKHRNYKNLDVITKCQFEQCQIDKNRDNNKFTRDLWYHLYHGTKKP